MSVFLCSVWVLSLFAWLKVGEDKGTQPVKRNILRQLKYPAPGSEQLELVHAISSPTRRQRVVRQVPIQLVPNPPDIPPLVERNNSCGDAEQLRLRGGSRLQSRMCCGAPRAFAEATGITWRLDFTRPRNVIPLARLQVASGHGSLGLHAPR